MNIILIHKIENIKPNDLIVKLNTPKGIYKLLLAYQYSNLKADNQKQITL